jgi:hypothetical protein
MALPRWLPAKDASALTVLCALLTVCAIALAAVMPGMTHASPSGSWPADARSMAGDVAHRWAANVPDTARLGAEPPGACQRLDGRHVACSIAIVVLASDGTGTRPWRCAATALVSRGGAAHRARTRCTPFPTASVAPAPVEALGTAYALQVNGDTACLAAYGGRTTCVMHYRGPRAERCVGAASVARTRPERSFALGTPVCRHQP